MLDIPVEYGGPATGHYPFCGINVKDMDYFNLNPSFSDDYFNHFFYNMNNGIVANNSIIDLTACKIEKSVNSIYCGY